MLSVVVNNSTKKEELDFKERVKQKMIEQIRKKLLKDESKFSGNKLSKAN